MAKRWEEDGQKNGKREGKDKIGKKMGGKKMKEGDGRGIGRKMIGRKMGKGPEETGKKMSGKKMKRGPEGELAERWLAERWEKEGWQEDERLLKKTKAHWNLFFCHPFFCQYFLLFLPHFSANHLSATTSLPFRLALSSIFLPLIFLPK